jgi:hypothetical protein
MTDDEIYRLYAITYARLKTAGVLKDADFGSSSTPEALRDLRAVVAIAVAAEDAIQSELHPKAELIPRVNELSGKSAPDYYNG